MSAPDGSAVSLDGKNIGSGSMRDYAVYEGNHHIVVMVEKYRWEQTFEIVPQQHLTFQVDFQ